MRRRWITAALLTLLGCARASDDPPADDAALAPTDAPRDSRDFDFGPDPFEDVPVTVDTPSFPDTTKTTPDAGFPEDNPPPLDVSSIDDAPRVVDTPAVSEVGGCSTGLTDCSGACIDTRTSNDHCGACNQRCAEVERCTAGVCTSTTPTCSLPRLMCGTTCVDVRSSSANCGGCGHGCPATSTCADGMCSTPTTMGCAAGTSDCDGNTANGCEVAHGTAVNSCAAPTALGSYCGDNSCGFLCSGTSWRTVSSQSDRRSRWFRARATECSNCLTSLYARVTLAVPAGIDYDLFVYRPCGSLIGQSIRGAGETDQVTISESDSAATSDSFDYFIEVRYLNGTACGTWTLTLEARANSATNC